MSDVVLVCGSLEWTNYTVIYERLALLPRGTIIRHGAARGADQLAGLAAQRLGFEEQPRPVHWKPTADTPPSRIRQGPRGPYDVAAGFIRNIAMLDEDPVPILVLGFQLNDSGGTQQTMDEAAKRGIPVEPMRRWTR